MENLVQGQWLRGPSADLGDEISQSLKFDSGGYLNLAQKSTGDGLVANNRTWTFSTWFKHGDMGETNIFGFHHTSANNWILVWTVSGTTYSAFLSRDHTGWQHYDSTQKHRDPNAWYHIFITCSSGVMTMKVNNVQRGGTVTQNHSMDRDFVIGAEHLNGGSPMDGWLADTYFIQNTVLDPVNDGFIRLNGDGVYVPSTPTISSYGTNGWHLTYDSSQANGIGHDSSGNGNHFTATGFDTTAISASNESNDIDIEDTPTKLYPTYNRVAMHSSQTTSEANLQTSASAYNYAPASIAIPADCGKKFYWEVTIRNNAGNETLGMCDPTQRLGQAPQHGWVFCPPLNSIESDQGNISTVVSTSDTAITTGNGTTYMFAYDADTQNVWIGDSGNWYRRSGASGNGDPANNSNPFLTTSDGCIVDGNLYAPATAGSSTGTTAYEINFGQMAFVHTPPSGFVELNSDNLPEPSIKKGAKHFGVLTYQAPGSPSYPITINGSGGNNGTGELDFDQSPDLVWIKMRNAAQNNTVFDSLRGNTKSLRTDETGGEANRTNFAFANNGFTFSAADAETYQQNDQYVAWCWKAGGAPTTDNTNSAGAAQTAGSVKVNGSDSSFAQGSIAVKKMSVNTDAGFSIVEYQGTGSAGTIPHGLGAVPEFAIFKRSDGTSSWEIYHKHIGNTKAIQFTDAAAQSASATYWNNTTPTSTLFHIGGGGNNNTNGEQVISYIWTPIEGYSKFGLYVGNNSTDGPFAYTGFRPAFVLLKRHDSSYGGEWSLFDTGRNTTNPADLLLRPDGASNERTGLGFDFLSNGFKILNTGDWQNQDGGQYFYAAFAENPFVGKNVPPVTAR